MKLIIAVIKPFKLEEVREKLKGMADKLAILKCIEVQNM